MPILTQKETTGGIAAEITVDASGNTLINKNDTAPRINASGYYITENGGETKTPPDAITTPPPQTEEKEAKTTDNPEKEARKLFLQAQKAQRKAAEMEKKAAASLAKAEAFDVAAKSYQQGKDPTTILTAAGLDPIQFYKDMTAYALSDKNKPEDPVQKELKEHKEKLDEYAKKNEELAKSIKDKEELARHNLNIQQQVVPLLENNKDQYECLLTEYGSQAAIEVYKTVWEKYQLDGTVVSFKDAADFMENYWQEQIESGIKVASKLKRFQKHFAQTENSVSNPNSDKLESPKTPRTLSNQPLQPQRFNTINRNLSREDRAAAIIKKFGG